MIRPDDLLHLAGQLAALSGDDEAMARAAVSRAYYAAFHALVQFFEQLGFDRVVRTRSHGLMPQCLLACEVESLVEAARLFNNLQRWRIVADYRLESDDLTSFRRIRHHVESASQCLRILEHTLTTDADAATTGITSYLDRRGL